MRYVDGFVIPMPRKKLASYMRMAKKASRIFREHGALKVRECAGDDFKTFCGQSFPRALKLKAGEVPVFSWIVFKSKADRNRVNKRVMEDKRMHALCDPKDMPFDMKRMVYGGFKAMVDA